MVTTVINLAEGREVAAYTLPPREAVIAAYAQFERRDWNTWEYERRYGALVKEGEYIYAIGDYSALKTDAKAVLEAEALFD